MKSKPVVTVARRVWFLEQPGCDEPKRKVASTFLSSWNPQTGRSIWSIDRGDAIQFFNEKLADLTLREIVSGWVEQEETEQ